jgi:hypothetical protein
MRVPPQWQLQLVAALALPLLTGVVPVHLIDVRWRVGGGQT